MDDGEDWLMRPVLRGLCRFESLNDPAMDLGDFVFMCEALDVEGENQMRLRKWAERK